jgi:hypothetical protein
MRRRDAVMNAGGGCCAAPCTRGRGVCSCRTREMIGIQNCTRQQHWKVREPQIRWRHWCRWWQAGDGVCGRALRLLGMMGLAMPWQGGQTHKRHKGEGKGAKAGGFTAALRQPWLLNGTANSCSVLQGRVFAVQGLS